MQFYVALKNDKRNKNQAVTTLLQQENALTVLCKGAEDECLKVCQERVVKVVSTVVVSAVVVAVVPIVLVAAA